MIVKQYQLPCLSLSSYFVGDETSGRAVVIDPQRDVSGYLSDALADGLEITHVLLTHFHADFVSGHLELAAATGAEICFGAPAEAEFPIRQLADGERIVLGEVAIEAVSTPGHTPESVTFALYERSTDVSPVAVFTGDTLFVDDVGRPDLLGAIGFTADELGRQLYDSVRRLAALPEEVIVYPGHGAGSACGKALGSEPFTTIGEQKRRNYALQPMTKDAFVALVTEGQPAAPAYFLHDAITNRRHHAVFEEHRSLPSLGIADVVAAQEAGSVVVDTRDPAAFAAGHFAGAVNVPLDGRFAEQAGMIVPADASVILVGDAGAEHEAMVRLGRIGFDRVAGYVPDYEAALLASPAWAEQSRRIATADVAGLDPTVRLIDVRNPGETANGMIPGAIAIPLGALPRRIDEVSKDSPVAVYCASGRRSSVAASYLRTQGYADVVDVIGGYDAWATLAAC